MAQNPACMNDDGNLAIFVGTNLDTGMSVTLCVDCFVQFCATMVEGLTGVPVVALLEADAEMSRALADEPIIDDIDLSDGVPESIATIADDDATADDDSTADTK
jgi:hypothetical protein